MHDVGRLQVRQHGKQCPRAADRVCQCEPVGKMELSNHGEVLARFMCLHGGQNLPLCQEVITPNARFPAGRTRDVMNGICPDKSENLLVVRQMNMIAIQTSKCIVIICRNYMSVLHLCQQYQMVF